MNTELNRQPEQRVDAASDRAVVRPPVDVFENQDELLLVADLPGVGPDGLTIHIDKDDVTVEGRSTVPAGASLLREFAPVEFRRSFVLPRGVDRERISAELEAGVLRLHLPKAEGVKPRRIQVTTG